MQIRDYSPNQASALLRLYRVCLAHYGIPAATSEEESRVVALLDAGRHMSCLMAYEEDTPLGFATWVLTFPAGTGLALYMKEIFVLDAARGKGVGRTILSMLLDRAEAEGCTRMDWQTDGSNLVSQNFYDLVGAQKFDKITYRIPQNEFATFRQRLTGPLAKQSLNLVQAHPHGV